MHGKALVCNSSKNKREQSMCGEQRGDCGLRNGWRWLITGVITNGRRVGRKQLSALYGAKLRQKVCAALKAPWIMLLHVFIKTFWNSI